MNDYCFRFFDIKDIEKFGITEKEMVYITHKISRSIKKTNDSCISHFRFDVDGKYAEEYNKIRESGCCGFCDRKLVLKSGKVVKYGFCFGH